MIFKIAERKSEWVRPEINDSVVFFLLFGASAIQAAARPTFTEKRISVGTLSF